MAFHAIKAGEGDAYISAGVETVSRFFKGTSDDIAGQDIRNPTFADPGLRTTARGRGGAHAWCDPRKDGQLPDAYIAMGQTAENVQQILGMSRHEQTYSRSAARTLPSSGSLPASGPRTSHPSRWTTAPWCRRTTAHDRD